MPLDAPTAIAPTRLTVTGQSGWHEPGTNYPFLFEALDRCDAARAARRAQGGRGVARLASELPARVAS